MRTLSLPLALSLLFVAGARAQATPLGDAVTRAIQAQCDRDGIPGLSCAIGIGDSTPIAGGFGLADVENDVPATGKTVYRLASISKPITAVCALRLFEQGRLDLDRPVHELVTQWPEKKWPVTTRQLLGHLGGVRHYRPGEGESTSPFATQTESLARFAADPLLHEPGTAYFYSTYGFNLVAAVVEQAAGKPFAELVRELVAAPGGAATLQDDDVRRIVPGRAQGYIKVGGVLQNSALMDSSYKLGGGGLCCSADDLVRFGQALVAGKLCKPETLALMWTAQQKKDGSPTKYGLGFGVAERNGRRVISHGGAQSRVSTLLYMLPDQKVVIALLCNLERVRLQSLAEQLADLVLAPEKK